MQYAHWISQAREHWEKNQPQKFDSLNKAGTLDKALREAAEATQEVMETLQAQGLDWHQSWEMVRELYLFPPAEAEAWPEAPPSPLYLAFAGLQQLRQQQAQEDGETPPDVSR